MERRRVKQKQRSCLTYTCINYKNCNVLSKQDKNADNNNSQLRRLMPNTARLPARLGVHSYVYVCICVYIYISSLIFFSFKDA